MTNARKKQLVWKLMADAMARQDGAAYQHYSDVWMDIPGPHY